MTLEGGCHCGQVRYAAQGKPEHAAFCHCRDCRALAGPPVMAWAACPSSDFAILSGEPRAYNSSWSALRHCCADCSTGLWYINEDAAEPGRHLIATLDDPEELTWMTGSKDLYPV